MKFPYVKYNDRYLPIVPIEMKGKEDWVVFVVVGDGSKIKVYIHDIEIRLADKEFRAVIGFSYRLGIGFNVLGQEDIFDRFRICFDKKERIVEFCPKSA